MKKHTHIELIEKARRIFRKHPGTDIIYATEDGQLFLDNNYARNHNRSIKGKLIEFNRNKIII